MKKIKSFLLVFLVAILCVTLCVPSMALTIKKSNLELNCKSAVLMDANTGTVLYENNADLRLSPASVTKVMTLLLVFEAINSGNLKYDDILCVSENAASMGGSQIFLEPGEEMTVEELLKSVIIASANDAAVTLAEHVSGSEEEFVQRMNEKATELGMKNTNFENVTGLDDDTVDHMTTARDIAIMSRELLKHEKVTEYTTIWMDTIRNGEFGLTNTNRLIRFYRGITGLKTGSTSKAGFCVSASAKRENLHLIAVIMGAESSDNRNISASKLLDFGFSNYSIYSEEPQKFENVKVYGGVADFVDVTYDKRDILINKADNTKIQTKVEMLDYLNAPVKAGDSVGKILYTIDGEAIFENDIYAVNDVGKINFWQYVGEIIKNFLLK